MPERAGDLAATWEAAVERGAVRAFARAVQDPAWTEEADVAPPTFPVTLTADYVERLIVEGLALDRSRTVHGEHEYRYLEPLRIGARVRCSARVAEDGVVEGRRGGAMRRVVIETELSDAATGRLIVVERSTALEKAAP